MLYAQSSICAGEGRTWDFNIQTNHVISARRPGFVMIKKKRTCKIGDFAVPADNGIKLIESEKKNKYMDLAWELKKTMEHEGDDCTNRDWCFWYRHRKSIKGTGGLEKKKTSGNHPNYYIIENGQDTEKSPGDLGRLAVTQTPMRNHLLKLMWKTARYDWMGKVIHWEMCD